MRIRAPSDRRRDKLRKSKCALNDSQGTLAPAPVPPGMTAPAPGPPGTTAPAPGPPGTTAPATGPPGTSASAPGPQGTLTFAPGTSAPAQGPQECLLQKRLASAKRHSQIVIALSVKLIDATAPQISVPRIVTNTGEICGATPRNINCNPYI